MGYRTEKYRNCERFNEQYREIHRFLLEAGELPHNEHFHWGRFEWMHAHSFLDEERLTDIVLFRDDDDSIVGLITYDTEYEDRTYLIHTKSDQGLLDGMIDAVLERENGTAMIKANSRDGALGGRLFERGFEKGKRDACVMALDLSRSLEYSLPDGYSMSPQGFIADPWQYQLVIHRGFGHTDIPEKWDEEFLKRVPNVNDELKTFVIADDEYCAHCGLWYTTGETAYVEPVVTLPQHRKKGLAKAALYEACSRARAMGAKRAVVLSGQEFYCRIGFRASSYVDCWERRKPGN